MNTHGERLETLTQQVSRLNRLAENGWVGEDEWHAALSELVADLTEVERLHLAQSATCPLTEKLLRGQSVLFSEIRGTEPEAEEEMEGENCESEAPENDPAPDSTGLRSVLALAGFVLFGLILTWDMDTALTEVPSESPTEAAPAQPTPAPPLLSDALGGEQNPYARNAQEVLGAEWESRLQPVQQILGGQEPPWSSPDWLAQNGGIPPSSCRREKDRDLAPWESIGTCELGAGIGLQIRVLRPGFDDIGAARVVGLEWTVPRTEAGAVQGVERVNSTASQNPGCSEKGGDGNWCWERVLNPDSQQLRWHNQAVTGKLEALQKALLRPLGDYMEGRKALLGKVPDLEKSRAASLEAIAGFGAVHPRLFHGNTVVNLCHAEFLMGRRFEARKQCRMTADYSREEKVRGEALYRLGRLALWDNETREALRLFESAADGVGGRRFKSENALFLEWARVREFEISDSLLRKMAAFVGCETGRAVGESWRWLPSELGYRDLESFESALDKKASSGAGLAYKKARKRCARSGR